MNASNQVIRRWARGGWTLVELLVVLVLAAGLAAVVSRTVWREQRSARAFAEIRSAQADLRDAASVLARELRGASLADTVRLAADTAIELFVPIAARVTCAPALGTQLLLAPVPPGAYGNTGVTPDTGDALWIWRADSIIPPGRWLRAQVASFSQQASAVCDGRFAGGSASAVTLRTDEGPIDAGVPVQFVRRVRHSIYRGSDGAWYLGYRRCDALGPSRCDAVQPVAGPYRARSGGVSGLQFRYFDVAGQPASTTGDIARIELVIRSDITEMERRTPRRTALDDSLAMAVTLRNAF